jgi:hypothetical protein
VYAAGRPKRYERIADTIVQLFRRRPSGVITSANIHGTRSTGHFRKEAPMTQAGQARESSDAKPGLAGVHFGSGLAHNSSVFDIFTTAAGGRAHFVLSVGSSFEAQEAAYRLSRLMPGEYFGYFERINEDDSIFGRSETRQEAI